jgi:hypothetical protein
MVVACISLFVALGSVGYAATQITGKQVKNSSLTGKDIKNSSLTGSDVKNSSLTGSDVKNDSLTGSDLLESSLGKVPTASQADAAGNAGNADKLDGVDSTGFLPSGIRVREATVPLADNSLAFADAQCGPGERLTGGGGRIEANPADDIALTVSRPETDSLAVPADGDVATGWRASAFNGNTAPNTTGATNLTSFALCAK